MMTTKTPSSTFGTTIEASSGLFSQYLGSALHGRCLILHETLFPDHSCLV